MTFADKIKYENYLFFRNNNHNFFECFCVSSIIWNIQTTIGAEDPFILPQSLFDEDKTFILMNVQYCEKTKINLGIIKKLHHFPNEKYLILIKLITKKVKSMFPLNDKNIHPVCKIYHGLCFCKENHTGKQKRNITNRLRKHNNLSTYYSGPAKLFTRNIQQSYNWTIVKIFVRS